MARLGLKESLLSFIKISKDLLIAGITGAIVIAVLIVTMCSGQLSHWVKTKAGFTSNDQAAPLELTAIDQNDPGQLIIARSMSEMWNHYGLAGYPNVMIYGSQNINAASLGYGRFLFSRSVASLPESSIDAIVAHELGHEIENHAREMEDLSGLADLLAEILAIFSGSTKAQEEDFGSIIGLTALPTYSRQQEYEADERAIEILRIYGYGDSASAVYARTLRGLLDQGIPEQGGFFSTHPGTAQRIARAANLPTD